MRWNGWLRSMKSRNTRLSHLAKISLKPNNPLQTTCLQRKNNSQWTSLPEKLSQHPRLKTKPPILQPSTKNWLEWLWALSNRLPWNSEVWSLQQCRKQILPMLRVLLWHRNSRFRGTWLLALNSHHIANKLPRLAQSKKRSKREAQASTMNKLQRRRQKSAREKTTPNNKPQ